MDILLSTVLANIYWFGGGGLGLVLVIVVVVLLLRR
jgi:hypothetical protein